MTFPTPVSYHELMGGISEILFTAEQIQARVLELGGHGIRESRWEDLEVVDHYRRFLSAPRQYLRHVIDDPF